MEDNKQKLVGALIEKPSIYEIEVTDNSMLPKNLKHRKTLTYVIKPQSIEVMALCTDVSYRIPQEIREKKDLKINEVIKYVNEMAEVISIMTFRTLEYPKWSVPFLLKNITAQEMYAVFYESMLKLQSDFFLQSFQIANQNPIIQ